MCVAYMRKTCHLCKEGKSVEGGEVDWTISVRKPWVLAFVFMLLCQEQHLGRSHGSNLMTMVFSIGRSLFQQDNVPCHTVKMVVDRF